MRLVFFLPDIPEIFINIHIQIKNYKNTHGKKNSKMPHTAGIASGTYQKTTAGIASGRIRSVPLAMPAVLMPINSGAGYPKLLKSFKNFFHPLS